MSTTYAFVEGSTFRGDANEVQAELERIGRTGGLTPRAVVTAARPKRSILHPIIFHVDEAEAAERYYESRARNLIRAVVIVDDEGPTEVRANVRVVDPDEGAAWVSINEPGAREADIARIRRSMAYLRRQLVALEAYPQVVMALDEALAAAA